MRASQAALPAGEGGAAAGPLPLPMLPPLPEGGQPAKREDLERVVRLVQKRDTNNIFKEPVTEEVVSGLLLGMWVGVNLGVGGSFGQWAVLGRC